MYRQPGERMREREGEKGGKRFGNYYIWQHWNIYCTLEEKQPKMNAEHSRKIIKSTIKSSSTMKFKARYTTLPNKNSINSIQFDSSLTQ